MATLVQFIKILGWTQFWDGHNRDPFYMYFLIISLCRFCPRGGHLNRARDLIIHDPAHHGANGAAMPTDEDDQDSHFFLHAPHVRPTGTRL